MAISPPLTAAEAAAALKVSLPTIYRLCRLGKLPVATEHPLRIPREAFERLCSGDGWQPAETPTAPVAARPTQMRQSRAVTSTGHDVSAWAERLYESA